MKKFLILLLFIAATIQSQAQWTYSSRTDPMTGKTYHFATVKSLNKVNLKWPYDGGTTFFLVISGKKNPTFVTLIASKGQFLYGGLVSIKFDYSRPFRVAMMFPSNGRTDNVNLYYVWKIVKKLKDARLLTIEAPFYQDGRKIIQFDVTGFKWNY